MQAFSGGVKITPLPSRSLCSCTLFVVTVALWDTIAMRPLLPTVKQDYWTCPLLPTARVEDYWTTKSMVLARTITIQRNTNLCSESRKLSPNFIYSELQQKQRLAAITNESLLKQRVYYFEYKHIPKKRLFPFLIDRNKDFLKVSFYGFRLQQEIGLGFKVSSLKVFPV